MKELHFRYYNKAINQMIAIRSMYWEGNSIHINDSLHDLAHSECMQYTGLKDKNGRAIYEGDIVLQGQYPHSVEWKSEYDEEFQRIREGWTIHCVYPELIEVIGNIYQNKELLT